jgi:hypothetical protein
MTVVQTAGILMKKVKKCKSCGQVLTGVMLIDPDLCLGCVIDREVSKNG